MRKFLSVMLCFVLILGSANMAFAALSNISVASTELSVVKGETAEFSFSVTNDKSSNANGTVFSVEGNNDILSSSFFTPVRIDIAKNATVQVTLTVDTSELPEGEYIFTVKASAPEIAGKGNSGQKASTIVSSQIKLVVNPVQGEEPTSEEPTSEEPTSEEPTSEPPITAPTKIHYVALGDSLVTGTTGISGTMKTYVHGVFAYLQSQYGIENVTKAFFGVDGDSSADLLNKVMNNPTIIGEISKADLITVSIGGNNIMPAARSSSFWSIDTTLADQGVANFEVEYNAIMDKIHELNPNAKVIVTTLYNPYNSANQPKGYSGDTKLYATANIYIDDIINKVIRSYSGVNYSVVEMHNHFSSNFGELGKMGDVTFFYPKYSALTWWFVKYTRDPHLNQKGQDEMLRLHLDKIKTIEIK